MSAVVLSPLATLLVVFSLGFGVSLIGDACHVSSGTTEYLWPGVPTLWRSGAWFPFLVGAAIVGVARQGIAARLPARRRTRGDLVLGVAAVLALYALTATLRGTPAEVAVTLCGSIAVAIWRWWDPSRAALGIAAMAALLGPLAEIAIMKTGAARYASDSCALFGVAPWLPCLYFAAGAVASGMWKVIERDGA
ncbi:MAG TPA: hypothetical protein VI299_22650, partial [Polyangiales bacterium]